MPWRAPSQLAANLCRESSIERRNTRGAAKSGRVVKVAGLSCTKEIETLAHTPLTFYSLYRPFFLFVCCQDEPVVMRREKAEPVQGRARGGAAVASLLAGRRPPAMQRCPYTTSVARPGSARTPPLRRESAPHARDSLFGAVPGTPTEARASRGTRRDAAPSSAHCACGTADRSVPRTRFIVLFRTCFCIISVVKALFFCTVKSLPLKGCK